MLAYRLCRDFGPPFIHPDYLLPCLTAEQFRGWERFYDQDPWGGEREDWRAMAIEITQNDPDTEVTLTYPYVSTDDELEARQEALETRRKQLDPEEVAAKFKLAREKHYAKKNV